jgi:hypothetical protein
MSRGKRWTGVALGLVAVVVAVVAAFWWSPWSGEGPYGHSLERYGDEGGEANRYVNLEDGAAQLSLGSPDGHRLVVQWRDPDGHGWTEPETVWADRTNTAIDSTVRYGGGTVVIVETYTPDTSDEDDSNDVHVGVVCRDLVCTATRKAGFGSEPQVTPDGRVAYLGQDARAVHLWAADGGFRRAPWSGHPGFRYREVSPSEPVLAPDGSLRVVSSRPSRGSCSFELLVSEPRSADLTRVARAAQPLRGRAGSDCRSYLDTYSADWLAVHPDDHRAPDFWFVRHAGSWTTTYDDPSGLELVDVSRGCCDTGVAGFVHWNDVAYGSPDSRRIQVQTHLLGQETWSDPMLLDGAPAGYACTWLESHEVGDGFAVLMTCHSGPSRDVFRGDAYAVAATADLEHWESAWVDGVRADPVVTGDRVRVGELSWTPDGGFDRR